ncbi:MAG: class I SAM-dependent methyltransferase [Anderseniella sp.]|jgi:caffeoyl-CoA O-methyltransferase|nr:class I SAM-dependent methyltransferase [Anderseniella sp.]
MAVQSTPIDGPLQSYIRSHSLHEPPVLAELRRKTEALPHGRWQSSPEQAQFISLLVQLLHAGRVLELGTFTGYGTLAMALALPDGGQVITCDIDEQYASIGQPFWQQAGVAGRVDLHIEEADKLQRRLLGNGGAGSFDMIFIDADKRLYPEYYENSVQLVRPGGLVLADNVLWGGAVADPADQRKSTAAIRRLNERVARDDRVDMTMLPMGDGLTIARKK